ncbi:MAG: hypothetical protein GYB65_19125 [Chloroflexi bacterium]|nr:hypothetical protein [Chloroflexota bacterium]
MAARRRVPFIQMVLLITALGWSLAQSPVPATHGQDDPDRTLTYGQTVTSQLSSAAPEENWTFTGRAGDVILIDMRAANPGELDTYLALRDAADETLDADDDGGEGGNSRLGPFVLPADGDYIIRAVRYSGGGQYTLRLLDLGVLPVLTAGKPLVGQVDEETPSDYFVLTTPADGQVPLLRLHVADDVRYQDPILSVYGPDGLITSTARTNEATIDPFVPQPGEQYVVVVAWNPESDGNVYELDLTASEVALLQNESPVNATLTAEEDVQTHFFRAERGQVVRVAVMPLGEEYFFGSFAPEIDVTTPDDTLTLFSAEGAEGRGVATLLAIPEDGVYRVEVRNSLDNDAIVTYSIKADWIEGAE